MKRLALTAFVVVFAAAAVGLLVSASVWPMVDQVETGKTPEYPDVQPHYYRTSPDEIFGSAVESVDALDHWERTSSDAATLTIEAERHTELLGFVDDIEIRVEPVTQEVARVHLRSASRIGYSDFGRNARNIEEFLFDLDERLAQARFNPNRLDPDGDQKR